MNKAQQAANDAGEYYRKGQWLCSEAVVTVINDMLNRPLPPEIVKLASGFPVGIGCAGCTCGALTGGMMALGLAFGRTEPGKENTGILKASKDLHDWFGETFGSSCCRILVKNIEFGGSGHIAHCTNITGSVAEYVAGVIGKENKHG